MKKTAIFISLMLLVTCSFKNVEAQTSNKNNPDSLTPKNLTEVTIVGRGSKNDYQQMPEIVGTNIYAGKKSALIVLDNVKGNVVNNTMRQVLAKIPGIHVWESDPSGIQIGIAARGLSPNRSWEFNTRQNGYDIAADPFGYPEAYYNPQLQAVQRIEIVRGQGSLQYGPQFGGLVNYILRNGSEIDKPFQFETQQTAGSNGLINSYNAIGGKTKKINYYSFFDHRNGNGWRQNSRFYTNAGFGSVTINISNRFTLSAELMQQHMRSQQAGGLTDSSFHVDAKQSLRSRNWFDILWTTPAIIANFNINSHTRWNTKLFSTIGNRNSVGFTQSILIKDSINKTTNEYNNRVLNADKYRNYGLESRIITDYYLGHQKHSFSGGIRLYTGTTSRLADGKGTTGTEYDMHVVGNYLKDITFRSNNVAAFAENIFHIGKRLLIIPGIRFEWLEGSASGRSGYDANGSEIRLADLTKSRSFILLGTGVEYHLTDQTEIYANYSQAYRPIQFANLQAPPTTDVVDPALTDARGYNIDLGYRGKMKHFLQFDLSGFYLQYNNRVGTITPAGATYRLITNVGNSSSKGFEGFAELNIATAIQKTTKAIAKVFVSYSYTDARYSDDHKDALTSRKKVENAPAHILRTGLTAGYNKFDFSFQFSKVAKAYSDANNTEEVTANGQTGLIPSYTVSDLSFSYTHSKSLQVKAGLNNIFDNRYFTRRAGGYPGPGALPADGRTFYISIAAKF